MRRLHGFLFQYEWKYASTWNGFARLFSEDLRWRVPHIVIDVKAQWNGKVIKVAVVFVMTKQGLSQWEKTLLK